MEVALDVVFQGELHVVPQVVEAELVVGAVGDVGGVGLAALVVIQAVDDHADGQSPRKRVELPHPFGVAFGQVVVDRDHVHAPAGEGVQVGRQGRHQGLTLAGLHLGDLAGMKHHAADQLHIEVAHPQHPLARLAADGEGLGEK